MALACKHAHYGTVPTPGGRKCEPGTNSSDMRLGISKQAKRHQDNKQENHEKKKPHKTKNKRQNRPKTDIDIKTKQNEKL